MSGFWDYLKRKKDRGELRFPEAQSLRRDIAAGTPRPGSRIHIPPLHGGSFTTTLGVRPGSEQSDDILEYPTEGYVEIPNLEDEFDGGYTHLFRINVSSEKMSRTFRTLARIMPRQVYSIIEIPMDLEPEPGGPELGFDPDDNPIHEDDSLMDSPDPECDCMDDDDYNIPYLSDFVDREKIMNVFEKYKFQIINDGMVGFGMAHYDEEGRHKELFLNCEKFFQVYTYEPEPVRMLLEELMIQKNIDTRFITETSHVHYSLHYLSEEDPKLRHLGAPHYNYEVFGPRIVKDLDMRKSWD